VLAFGSRVEYDDCMMKARIWSRRASIVVGLIVLVAMVMDFNSRMARLTHLRTQKGNEEQHLIELKLTRALLQEQIAYVSSDAAVEEWAREEGRMMLPGDIAVVPLPDASFVPETIEDEVVYPEPQGNWDAWMQWLSFRE
jgi:cell division protein FtsB